MRHQLSDCHPEFSDQLKLKKENQCVQEMTNKNLIIEELKNRQIFITILQNICRPHCRNCDENFQKQPSRGFLIKRYSENMQQIYRRTPTPKCDFNKVALQLY